MNKDLSQDEANERKDCENIANLQSPLSDEGESSNQGTSSSRPEKKHHEDSHETNCDDESIASEISEITRSWNKSEVKATISGLNGADEPQPSSSSSLSSGSSSNNSQAKDKDNRPVRSDENTNIIHRDEFKMDMGEIRGLHLFNGQVQLDEKIKTPPSKLLYYIILYLIILIIFKIVLLI